MSLALLDGKRCAETIKSIFDNAKDPDKVIIGVIEQNDPADDFCLSAYCDFYGTLGSMCVLSFPNSASLTASNVYLREREKYTGLTNTFFVCLTGVKTITKRKIRDDVTKMMVVEGREEKCPRFKQIRYIAFFNIAASGPNGARAMTRKIVGNEEYCMQIDAHTQFVSEWDQVAKEEWKNAKNEFAIISTVPAKKSEVSDYESWSGSKNGEVPRQCNVRIADNDIPVS